MFYIVYNPDSTNADTGQQFIDEIKNTYGASRIKVINQGADKSDDLFDSLVKVSPMFDDDTIIGVAAGDGTVSGVINTLLTHKDIPEKSRKVPILPLWSGNANDLAVMLNGAKPDSIDSVIKKGMKVKIYPIICRLTGLDGAKSTYLGSNYVSFGASGYAAQQLNTDSHRDNPLHRFSVLKAIGETVATLKGIGESKSFRIVEGDRVHYLYERLFMNGSRFAKNQVFPVELEKPGYTVVSFSRKNLLLAFIHMLNLLRKNKLKQQTGSQRFTVHDDIIAQFDGETFRVTAGTRVEISLSDRPFYALSTLLGDT